MKAWYQKNINEIKEELNTDIQNGLSEEKVKEYLEENTVEGLYTVKSIYKLLKDKKAIVPIIDLIYNICMNKEKPNALLTFLVEKI